MQWIPVRVPQTSKRVVNSYSVKVAREEFPIFCVHTYVYTVRISSKSVSVVMTYKHLWVITRGWNFLRSATSSLKLLSCAKACGLRVVEPVGRGHSCQTSSIQTEFSKFDFLAKPYFRFMPSGLHPPRLRHQYWDTSCFPSVSADLVLCLYRDFLVIAS